MEFTRYDAMTLNFQDGKFAGWFLGNEPGADSYSTMSGIAVGTARAKAAESVTIVDIEDSTLGEEFSIGTGDKVIGGMFAAPGRSEEGRGGKEGGSRLITGEWADSEKKKNN